MVSAIVQTANAGGSLYQIALLVFDYNLQSTVAPDKSEDKIQWPTALLELSSYQQTNAHALKDGAAKLFTTSNYRQILHYAWVQSTGPGNAILPMHIVSEDGRLDGFIHLRNAQPFELTVNLEYLSLNVKDPTAKPYTYRLNEKRPIKLNETQYFDHPKLGVLVQIKEI